MRPLDRLRDFLATDDGEGVAQELEAVAGTPEQDAAVALVLEAAAADPEWLLHLVDLFVSVGRYRDAAEVAQQAADESVVGAVTACAAIAADYFDDPVTGERLYRQAVAARDAAAACYLARMVLERGDDAEAEDLYRNAVEWGDFEHAYRELADVWVAAGRVAEAEALLRRGLAAGHPRLAHDLADLLHGAGRLDEVEPLLRRAIDAGVMGAHNDLAMLFLEADRVAEAREELRRGIDAGHALAARNFGQLLLDAGDLDDAFLHLSLAVDRGDLDALLDVAVVQAKRGDPTAAIATLERARQAGVDNALVNLAYVYDDDLGDPVRAERVLQDAVAAGETDAPAALAALYEALGRTDEAIDWYARATSEGSDNGSRSDPNGSTSGH